MGVSEIGFPQNVVYKQRIQTSDTLPVTIGASKYCQFEFDIDAGDRMTPLGIVGWGCDDKTQVFLLDFYMDNDLQTAKLILKNPYATTIAISSLYIDVLYSKQGLDMSEVDVVDNLTTDSAVAALSARQGKLLNEQSLVYSGTGYCKMPDGTLICWGNISKEVSNWSTWGNIQAGNITGSFAFAQPFISAPSVNATINTTWWAMVLSVRYDANAITEVAIARPSGATSTYSVSYIAVGRWK